MGPFMPPAFAGFCSLLSVPTAGAVGYRYGRRATPAENVETPDPPLALWATDMPPAVNCISASSLSLQVLIPIRPIFPMIHTRQRDLQLMIAARRNFKAEGPRCF